MKKGYAIALCLFLAFTAGAQVTKEVLFLGNSYTYVNNLPQLIKDIALSKGDTLIFDLNCPGGYTLQGHSTNATSLSKINARNWDHVVLQEQSQLPSFSPAQVATDVYPYAQSLNAAVKANDSCTQTLFYMTWGRKNGDAGNCGVYPPVCTYLGMQQRLRDSYVQMAVNNGASVAPVGVAWKEVRTVDTNINLYQADESHPSILGSYLAACVFYSSMFHKSSSGATSPSGVPSFQATILQSIADQTVFDSLSTWRIDTADLKANYSINKIAGYQYFFTAHSNRPNAVFQWNIDGSIKSDSTFQHTFPGPGNYLIGLTVIEGCDSLYFEENLNIGLTSMDEQRIHSQKLSLYPNPAGEVLYVDGLEPERSFPFSVKDIDGKDLLSGRTEGTIQLADLPKGLYFIRLVDGGETLTGRFVRE